MLPRRHDPLSIMCRAGRKGEGAPDFKGTKSHLSQGEDKKSFSKVKEQSANVYENKGSVIHRPAQSGNVVENKDSYELKAGMLLKIHGLVLVKVRVNGNNHE
jgi:hypothetical protein